MADKRISQLIERTDIANNDVLPIVASGATTTNKVTVSTLQDWMQDNLDVGVTSVGLSVPSAFTVSGSPVTTSGNITISGAGTTAQYIRGDGSLADFPSSIGGGGASVSYYLNGSVSQGTIGGVAYRELSKSPILGAGTDFTINADGYIASFITDAGDPSLLEIPGGNWNFETYFQASSGGGTPTFYVELYKVSSGGTATLIATSSGSPELIAFGTNTTPYFSSLAVPTTTLALTDRLAIRYYVAHSGRTITLHTENSHLCQIITTFTTGLTALNGLTAQVQNFATGISGTDFGISSSGSTHTFNLPDASATARGVVTTGTQTFAGYKIFNGTIGANVDIQLATVGTALNTFLKNINSTGLTSIGSNGFGFNNANNIYFSGSNKGGGVFAFSNSGTQTYTLQNASGTLAFTSDLGAYLPLTGGTLTGAINGTSANFTGNLASDTSVIAGQAFRSLHSGSVSTINGYNSIQGDANAFVVANTTKGFRINFPSNSSFTHTLPDASGTIALTSNLSAYLPLSGGTLTGALNGTSASFTGKLSVTQASTDFVAEIVNTQNATPYGLRIKDAASGANGYPLLSVSNNSGSVEYFRVNSGTGTATFSSSVTAAGNIFTTNDAVFSTAGTITRHATVGLVSRGVTASVFDWSVYSAGGTALISNPTGTNNIIFNSGSVGIGTASPATRLHIEAATQSYGQARIINTSTDGEASIHYGRSGQTLEQRWTVGQGTAGIDTSFGFYTGGSNRLVLTTAGNVGIGTASVGVKLEVFGAKQDIPLTDNGVVNITDSSGFAANSGGSLVFRGIYNSSGSTAASGFINTIKDNSTDGHFGYSMAFGGRTHGAATTERMRITSGGNVLINRNTLSSASLSLTGTLQVNNEFISTGVNGGIFWENRSGGVTTNSNWYGWYTPSGTIFLWNGAANAASINPSTGAYTALSDVNKKKDFEDSKIGLNEVLNLKPTLYRIKDDESEGEKELGFIAQEVKEFIPQAYVESGEEDDKFIGLNYNAIVAALVKSVQELKAEIDSLKTK